VVADDLAHGVAGQARQVPVEDDYVVGDEVKLARGLEPVVDDVDRESLVSEPVRQRVGQRARILTQLRGLRSGP